jgi:hypothetical protein
MPPLSSFNVVRVIVIDSCHFVESAHLEHIGKLLHLRYLGLVNTAIAELPKEVGHLKFLQTLDIWGSGIEELPLTVGKLRQLIYLRTDSNTRVPAEVMGKLTSLQQLHLHSVNKSLDAIVELRKLEELRELGIWFDKMDHSSRRVLVESVCNLRKIQVLGVWYKSGDEWTWLNGWEAWVPHPRLRQFFLNAVFLPRIPVWINSSRVAHLSYLHLGVDFIDVQDLETVGRLPALRCLYICSSKIMLSYIVAGDDGLFQNLRNCATNLQLTFRQGAMPMLEHLQYSVSVVGGKKDDVAPSGGFCAPTGLGHLPFLDNIILFLLCSNASAAEVEEVEAMLREEVSVHPNHPSLKLKKT